MHACPRCGQQTTGWLSERGVRWPLCNACLGVAPTAGRTPLTLLVVEDDTADAYILCRSLRWELGTSISIEVVQRLADAIERLARGPVDVVLVDLNLPDSSGIQSFRRLHEAAPEVAAVVLSGQRDLGLAVQSVREGAQDYLSKDKFSGELMVRSILYALERHHLQQRLRELTLTDELTGLYNLRGFNTVGPHLLDQARRRGERLQLIFAEVEEMTALHAAFGHDVGHQILIETATLLRRAFSEADLIARLGVNDFVVLRGAGVERGEDPVVEIRRAVSAVNGNARAFPLAIDFGTVLYEEPYSSTLDHLVRQADRDLWKRKTATGGRAQPAGTAQ